MNPNLHLTLTLLLSISDQNTIATNQTLAKMYHQLDLDPAKKSLLRLLPLLTPHQRDWVKNLF